MNIWLVRELKGNESQGTHENLSEDHGVETSVLQKSRIARVVHSSIGEGCSRANWKCKSFFGNYTGQVKFMKSFFSCKNLFFWQGRKFFYRNTLHMVLKSILFCIFIKYSKKILEGENIWRVNTLHLYGNALLYY